MADEKMSPPRGVSRATDLLLFLYTIILIINPAKHIDKKLKKQNNSYETFIKIQKSE